jgi:hypothetical protein
VEISEGLFFGVIEECRRYLQSKFESVQHDHQTLDNDNDDSGESDAVPKRHHTEIYVKPEFPAHNVQYVPVQQPKSVGGSFYEREQLEEIEVLKSKFASFRLLQGTDSRSFAIRLAPTKNPKADLLLVDVLFSLTKQYPHDYPDIAVTCVSGHGTKRHAKGLTNFLTKYAERHHGRKLVFELLAVAKKWIFDQNNYLLIKNGYWKYLEEAENIYPPPEKEEVIIDLLQFELDGKMKLINIACNSIVSEVRFGNTWNARKMEFVKNVCALLSIIATQMA